jgi:hypothetical protein
MTEPVTSRPHKLTRMCWGLAVFVALVFAAVGAGLRSGGRGDAAFQLADQIAMTLLGVLIGSAALLLTRPRVVADASGVRVRNVLGFTYFPWEVVTAVRLDDGASWASLELHDDDTVALLAVQSNDGERAVDVVLALRRLLAASRSRP